jgi:hypothetical protein
MDEDVRKYHFVFRTAAGLVLLEFDASLHPPVIGTVIHLPSANDLEKIIPYRIAGMEFAPESPEQVTIYIEVEPA